MSPESQPIGHNLISSPLSLPVARHLALEWWVPDNFAGMTSAIFHRSRAFVQLGGAQVDVLTFDNRHDYADLTKRLTANGTIVPGIRLLNLWDYFADLDSFTSLPGSGTRLDEHPFTPLTAQDHGVPDVFGGVQFALTRFAADRATVLQVDHFRPDGSLLLTDRRDTKTRGSLGGRSVVLCDRNGIPVRAWGRIWDFYAFWLDHLIASEPTVAIIDSKVIANFAATYRRPNVATMHVIHNSHLATEQRPYAPLRPSRAAVLRKLQAFDAVVLLTNRQRQDVEMLLGPANNYATIPNSVELPPDKILGTKRQSERGVMLASLQKVKRIDHAIRAVAVAAAGSTPVRLDIYGHGHEQLSLQTLIDELGAGEAIRLAGFDPNAHENFLSASFFLLTSKYEGFPLVLLEGMAGGCIPIAYDVPYGPADIIEHGRNGYLISPGNYAELADTIAGLVSRPAADLLEMRMNARATAERYSDTAVTRLWAEEMTHALARSAEPYPLFDIIPIHGETVRLADQGILAKLTFNIRIGTRGTRLPATATIALSGDSPAVEVRTTAPILQHGLRKGHCRVTATFTTEQVAWLDDPQKLNLIAEVKIGNTVHRVTFPPHSAAHSLLTTTRRRLRAIASRR